MNRSWLELAPRAAIEAAVRRPGARLVPYRGTRMRLKGEVTGGGRLLIGRRWPEGFYASTEFIVQDGAVCTVTGEYQLLTGCSVIVGPGARLRLGSGYMNRGTAITCYRSVAIGEDVVMGPEVVIMDSDQHAVSGAGASTRPVTIGDHVWIGARAMILKGVTIGDGAVVAAGAIVTKDVAPGMLVAGSPAKAVRAVTWTREPNEGADFPEPTIGPGETAEASQTALATRVA